MNTTQQQQQNLSGAHPATVDDMTHTSHNNINPQSSHLSGAHPATVGDVNQSSHHHLSGSHPTTDINQSSHLSGAHPATVGDVNQQSSHHHLSGAATDVNQSSRLSGAHPATVNDVNQSSHHHLSGSHPTTDVNQSSHLSGAHPATVDDVNQPRNTVEGAPHNNTSLWMKKPENAGASAISSTPSEHGSNNSSRHSPQANRPVADKNAFIQTDETNKHWQNNISPAERAKQLATEMDHTLQERRKSASSSNSNDKTFKIAQKEINLN